MATNNILTFAETAAALDIYTDVEYLADTDQATGNKAGKAKRKLNNKALKQATKIAAGVAQFLADIQTTNITDVLTTAQISTILQSSLLSDGIKRVRVASTVAISIAAPGGTIDGVTMVAGDRFLEKDNATASARGIYVWNGAAVPATRALDSDNGAKFPTSTTVSVSEGAANLDTNWQLTTDGTIIIGTTALTFAQTGAQSASIQGAFKNLQASASGLSANVLVTVDEIAVSNPNNAYQTLRAVNLNIAGTSVGANGLDTGSLAINSWYSVWVIWNGTTTAGLLSLSATAPTMPSGYTHKARVGWIRTDANAGNKYPLSFKQYGRRVQYVVASGSNVTGLLALASGTAGNITTPTWVSVGVGAFVPPTAVSIRIGAKAAGLAVVADIILAPNNSYGGKNSVTNPPYGGAASTAGAGGDAHFNIDMLLESTSIFWASAGTTTAIHCAGFDDNI